MTDFSKSSHHVSVLPKESLEFFRQILKFHPEDSVSKIFIDATFGGGGHARMFLEASEGRSDIQVLGCDWDHEAIERAEKNFSKEIGEDRLRLLHQPFGELGNEISRLTDNGIRVVGILADLGFSSDQLDEPERGLSFREDGPLDMRLSHQFASQTCRELLESESEEELEKILREYGEERFSKQIARHLKELVGSGKTPETTKELSNEIIRAIPSRFRHRSLHASTRSFQALRIAVNGELQQVTDFLNNVMIKLPSGAFIGVMSFHSLEDRLVKRASIQSVIVERVNKKAIQATREEAKTNTRARSVRFRIMRRR